MYLPTLLHQKRRSLALGVFALMLANALSSFVYVTTCVAAPPKPPAKNHRTEALKPLTANTATMLPKGTSVTIVNNCDFSKQNIFKTLKKDDTVTCFQLAQALVFQGQTFLKTGTPVQASVVYRYNSNFGSLGAPSGIGFGQFRIPLPSGAVLPLYTNSSLNETRVTETISGRRTERQSREQDWRFEGKNLEGLAIGGLLLGIVPGLFVKGTDPRITPNLNSSRVYYTSVSMAFVDFN